MYVQLPCHTGMRHGSFLLYGNEARVHPHLIFLQHSYGLFLDRVVDYGASFGNTTVIDLVFLPMMQ